MNKKRIIIFTSIAYILAWALSITIPLTGQNYGSLYSTLILMAVMFMPTIANLVTRLVTREGFHNLKLWPKFKGHMKYYLFAYLSMPVLIILGLIVYFAVFNSTLDIHVTQLYSLFASQNIAFPIWAYLLISMAIAPLINILPTLGEEFGWRAYLLIRLKEECGTRKAIVFTGIIWGIWHMPMIIMGHNYGTDYPGYPVLGILLMTVMCIVVGILEGYVTIKTDSAIPAAMIHSALNALAALGMAFCTEQINPLLGPTFCGVIVMIPAIILAFSLLLKLKKENC